MSTNQTASYQLHLWEPGDDFLREEFNENFEKLDAAARVTAGVFTGDGTESRFIDLGFTPLAVLVESRNGTREQSTHYAIHDGLALPGHPVGGQPSYPIIEVVSGGFRVYAYSGYAGNNNVAGNVYHYLAFR